MKSITFSSLSLETNTLLTPHYLLVTTITSITTTGIASSSMKLTTFETATPMYRRQSPISKAKTVGALLAPLFSTTRQSCMLYANFSRSTCSLIGNGGTTT